MKIARVVFVVLALVAGVAAVVATHSSATRNAVRTSDAIPFPPH